MLEQAVKNFIEKLIHRKQAEKPGLGAVSSLNIFTGMSEASLQTLLSNSHIREIPAGRQIVQQGDCADTLYYILDGKVRTQRFSAKGSEVTIRLLGKGDTFMDAAIFMGEKSPISVQSVDNSRLLLIPAETVHRQVANDPQFSRNLLHIVTWHYKTAIQQIDSIAIKNPVERLGYYLLRLHIQNGSEDMKITLPFKKAMIANHLGMTPETFSRALGQIRKKGIDIDQETLTMHDAYALCHFCDTDTASCCPHFGSENCSTSHKSCSAEAHVVTASKGTN